MIALLLEQFTTASKIILGVFLFALLIIIINYSFKMVEIAYVLKSRRPFFVHFYPLLKKLKPQQKAILQNQFPFYKKLDVKLQRYFEHRVASFIVDKDFVGRNSLIITDEMKVLISATAVMLTFGFRDFYISLIDKILIYPDAFFSKTNEEYHKGEFNPFLKTLVISWEDFKQGFEVYNDKINLGVHEFAHAIHLNSMKERDVSSTIFSDSFKELTDLLSSNKILRDNLVASKYFRNYAYTNQYEFLAVIIETFIEAPQEFKSQFPEVYNKTKQMLNFNFAGY
ncbi:MAG TPA: zinc-dependent peptidase [Flavobacteriaceae bacterium]|nr:zinc-dependent peptidase [Flavobacteriaceae bacterium]